MSVDLGVMVSDITEIESFGVMAENLRISGFAVVGLQTDPIKSITENVMVYSRTILTGKAINSVRKQIDKIRKKWMIVSVPLKSIEVANWAAEDKRVDLLTIDPSLEHRLRDTTAHLASTSNTSLEIQIAPLLKSSGLNRSKILKLYRESVSTAVDAGMNVVLTSGTSHPMGLRSSVAMAHIGILLGMERAYADNAVDEFPRMIVERNMKKLHPSFISSGIEIIKQGEKI
jgi:RNase P/RNase MRP subunit p30